MSIENRNYHAFLGNEAGKVEGKRNRGKKGRRIEGKGKNHNKRVKGSLI